MITILRRLLLTERRRMLVIAGTVMLFMLMMIVVYDEVGGNVVQTKDLGAMGKGFDIRAFIDPDSILANFIGIAMTHPLFLAIVGSIAIGFGARSCAGELEEGTLELTLARPVARRTHMLAYIAFINVAVLMLMMVTAASVLGFAEAFDVSGRIGVMAMLSASAHGWLLYSSFGALAMLISTLAGSRSAAMFSAIALLAGTYFIELFARMWSPIEKLGYVSPFHYYTPTDTLRGYGSEWADIAVLATIIVVANIAAVVHFDRRDLV